MRGVTDRDELAAWLQLLETPGVGRLSARRLLAAFGSPQGALAASEAARRDAAGRAAAEALRAPPPNLPALLDATLAWLDGGPARRIVTLGDALYPAALLESPDPPLLLYLDGRAGLLAAPSIAVVGSRHATAQGLANARAFSEQLARAGWAIVSGLAQGIDAAAHDGALRAGTDGGAGTVAVVGTGLDSVYPPRHRALAQRIAGEGLLVSEYSLGTPPLGQNFPRRNRIIAGLARATLVVEAAPQSGSLITARLANEAGREVLAIPGSIHSPQSRGCHALIKQGAKLVESVEDILEELRPAGSAAAPARGGMQDASGAPLDGGGGDNGDEGAPPRAGDVACADAADAPDAGEDGDGDPLLRALGFDPVTLDALAERTGWPPAELNVRLLELELQGRVARLPGQRFQRVAQA
jgi:DNA processing protein